MTISSAGKTRNTTLCYTSCLSFISVNIP